MAPYVVRRSTVLATDDRFWPMATYIQKTSVPFLVDDRINGNDCFSGSSVADDQLSLSSSDGDHGVNSLDTCLDGLFHGLTDNDTRCGLLQHS